MTQHQLKHDLFAGDEQEEFKPGQIWKDVIHVTVKLIEYDSRNKRWNCEKVGRGGMCWRDESELSVLVKSFN